MTFKDGNPSRIERWLRIVPAGLTLGVFTTITLLSFIAPRFIASVMLLYVLYWFLKSILMSAHLIAGYRSYRRAIATNWMRKLEHDPATINSWHDIWHILVIANANERLPIVQSTLEAIAKTPYPKDRIIIVLANEARYHDIAEENQRALKKEFGKVFAHFWPTLHPEGIVGEVRGKGANISYAARTIVPKITALGLNPENVLLTTLDADNRVHPQFLPAVTHAYLTTPGNRTEKSFQPLPMFFNNIWSVPYIIRSIAVGSSFWHMIEATRPYRLRNFSSHTQPLALLLVTDFWSTNSIVEDGHQYWRSLFATNGRHTVTPVFVPIYQDAVLSPKGQLMSYREQYLQKLRWAWGASDIPYTLTRLWAGRKELPLGAWMQGLRLIEGHFSWAATSLLLAVFGWLPILLNPDFQGTVFSYYFTIFYQRMLLFAGVGMIVSLVISRLLLPPRPKHRLTSNDLVEWILTPFLLPITNIIFASMPAIDAQQRIARGKEIGFRVTEKAVERATLPVTDHASTS